MDLNRGKTWGKNVLGIFFPVFLALYPLRHVATGVDLMDGGYNYANFMFSGTEHMDSMWFFATWFANQTGALLMKLPFADTMLGMNVYTGMIVSLLALAGFLFCVKILRLPSWLAFLGEFAACSLCWAPTAVLYNYLTYLFLLAGSILLYIGLVKEKSGCLAAAGVMLALNVGVRFSNLVQAGLILVVWIYAFLARKKWKDVLRETGFCMLGYFSALGAFFLLMGALYGFEEYIDGILRLFQMTENATDYSPAQMLLSVGKAYWKCGYWIKRFLLIFAGGMAICLAPPRRRGEKVRKLLCLLLTAGLAYWLVTHHYFAANYSTYETIYDPCIMVFVLTFCLSLFFVVKKGIAKEDKLPALFAVFTIFLTSLGSNNAAHSSINNLFLVFPFLLYMLWKLCREQRNLLLFPAKALITAALLILMVQAVGFGWVFVYEEATGGIAMDCEVEGVPVLRGMKTNEEKGKRLTELYEYLTQNGLEENEVILYGQIPGVAYYMELPPAINIWSDLRSYSLDTMRGDMERLTLRCASGGQMPTVILEGEWAEYLKEPELLADYWDQTAVEKLGLIRTFMDTFSYEKAYDNGKYVVFLKNTVKNRLHSAGFYGTL